MAFKEKRYSFRDGNGITHKRVITGEEYQHGKRIYLMIDPEMNTHHTGIADEIDALYLPDRGAVVPKSRKGIKTIDKRLQRSGGNMKSANSNK